MKWDTRKIRELKLKKDPTKIQMLTCYDYQTARMFNESSVDLLLVGDSVGNVVLGYETTVSVTLEEMIVFGSAVRRGAPNKFLVVDMPFGTTVHMKKALEAATELFQKTGADALKIEGGFPHIQKLIKRLTQSGIPVMAHIGLTPQSVFEFGGYYTHGKTEADAQRLIDEAKAVEKAGAFSVVLEVVNKDVAKKITESINIPTIGIGAGKDTDGQVLVINDLLKNGPDTPPKFCTPIADFYSLKKELVEKYLADVRGQ
jgi:3-methyl-2-oxobutanoate hydroxymethyltransferase